MVVFFGGEALRRQQRLLLRKPALIARITSARPFTGIVENFPEVFTKSDCIESRNATTIFIQTESPADRSSTGETFVLLT
jgi:hypothetical protein